jgi:hypothetical protein
MLTREVSLVETSFPPSHKIQFVIVTLFGGSFLYATHAMQSLADEFGKRNRNGGLPR